MNESSIFRFKISEIDSTDALNQNRFIEFLCKLFDGQVMDVKTIYEFEFKTKLNAIHEMINKQQIKTSTNLIDFTKKSDQIFLFESLCDLRNSYSFLNKLYEIDPMDRANKKQNTNKFEIDYSLDFDERIFLSNETINLNNTDHNETQDLPNQYPQIRLPDCLEELSSLSLADSPILSKNQKCLGELENLLKDAENKLKEAIINEILPFNLKIVS